MTDQPEAHAARAMRKTKIICTIGPATCSLEMLQKLYDAGMNVVRMGEFSWGLCEREEGKYDFEWLRRAMDAVGRAGIKVVLGTPTAAPPRVPKVCFGPALSQALTSATAATRETMVLSCIEGTFFRFPKEKASAGPRRAASISIWGVVC